MDKSSIFNTINDPSRVTFGNLSERKGDQTSFQAATLTSRLPEINKSSFSATAKTHSRRKKPLPASVFVRPN